MLPKKNRIKRIEFPSQKTRGFGVHGKYITLYFYNTKNNDSNSRFSVVVSKKTAKKAVDRNLLKRRAYASIKNIVLDVKKPITCVLYIKKSAREAPPQNLKLDIEKTFKKSKLT